MLSLLSCMAVILLQQDEIDICASREFIKVILQVIKCRLAYIEPCEAAGEWSKETTGRFKEMTEDKSMVCSVVGKLPRVYQFLLQYC